MKKPAWYLFLLPVALMTCKASPPAVESVAVPLHEEEPGVIEVTQEVYDHTLAEVKLFVEKLNLIIKNKDYAAWRDALSDEFFARISSAEFLATASESKLLRSQKLVLTSPSDYFLYVVVPARSNSRVDEIEFVATNAVKVFYVETIDKRNNTNNMVTTEIRRLRLYELIKKSGNTWKIID